MARRPDLPATIDGVDLKAKANELRSFGYSDDYVERLVRQCVRKNTAAPLVDMVEYRRELARPPTPEEQDDHAALAQGVMQMALDQMADGFRKWGYREEKVQE